jgi:histidinol phosphatase-like PHP family hydrolase
MKLDLHVHSSEYSACAVADAETQIRAAISAGLDGLVFTNHHAFVPEASLDSWNAEYRPFRVYGGIEITVKEGEDLLVIGMRDPSLQSKDWEYAKLHRLVRSGGGYLVLAHPFRYRNFVGLPLEELPPDAIEVGSLNTPRASFFRIRRLAKRLGAKPVCDSDAHSPERIGAYYNLTKKELPVAGDLAAFLHAGEFKGVSK